MISYFSLDVGKTHYQITILKSKVKLILKLYIVKNYIWEKEKCNKKLF